MKKEISQEIATRKRSINYYSLGTSYLPDPDIVLRKQGKDMKVYKEIGKMGTQEMGYEVINIFDFNIF